MMHVPSLCALPLGLWDPMHFSAPRDFFETSSFVCQFVGLSMIFTCWFALSQVSMYPAVKAPIEFSTQVFFLLHIFQFSGCFNHPVDATNFLVFFRYLLGRGIVYYL